VKVSVEAIVKGNIVIYFPCAKGVFKELTAVRAGEVSVKVGVGCWIDWEHSRLLYIDECCSEIERGGEGKLGYNVNSPRIFNRFFNDSGPPTPPE
jgi:hypothetical protein